MSESLDDVHSEAAHRLVSSIEELETKGTCNNLSFGDDDFHGLCSRVKSARIGYPLVLDEQHPQAINRLGSVLLGPVFTSERFPWPIDEAGEFMAPLCQINTEQMPQSLAHEEGLVQVWLLQTKGTTGDALIRVIPQAEVEASLLTPVIPNGASIDVLWPDAVEWLRDFHRDFKPSKKQYISSAAEKLGYSSADELSDADWDKWVQLSEEYVDKHGDDVAVCWQISGFEEGRLYCDSTEDQRSAVADLSTLMIDLEKNQTNVNPRAIPLLDAVCEAYKAWEGICGEAKYPCLFGTFLEIQYSADKRPAPFLCFESDDTIGWGDSGNAQVFYDQDRGFSFDWSCT